MKRRRRVTPGRGNPRESATENETAPGPPGAQVKRWGKSPPRTGQPGRHGKPRREQCRIGASGPGGQPRGQGRFSPRGPGWQHERTGDGAPRGMAIEGGNPGTESGLQATRARCPRADETDGKNPARAGFGACCALGGSAFPLGSASTRRSPDRRRRARGRTMWRPRDGIGRRLRRPPDRGCASARGGPPAGHAAATGERPLARGHPCGHRVARGCRNHHRAAPAGGIGAGTPIPTAAKNADRGSRAEAARGVALIQSRADPGRDRASARDQPGGHRGGKLRRHRRGWHLAQPAVPRSGGLPRPRRGGGRSVVHPVKERVMPVGLDVVASARHVVLASGGRQRAVVIRAIIARMGPRPCHRRGRGARPASLS